MLTFLFTLIKKKHEKLQPPTWNDDCVCIYFSGQQAPVLLRGKCCVVASLGVLSDAANNSVSEHANRNQALKNLFLLKKKPFPIMKSSCTFGFFYINKRQEYDGNWKSVYLLFSVHPLHNLLHQFVLAASGYLCLLQISAVHSITTPNGSLMQSDHCYTKACSLYQSHGIQISSHRPLSGFYHPCPVGMISIYWLDRETRKPGKGSQSALRDGRCLGRVRELLVGGLEMGWPVRNSEGSLP